MSNGQKRRTPVERRKPWRREIVWVAALAIIFVVVGWVRVGNFSAELREATVDGCQRQNEVRDNLSRTTETLRKLIVVSLEIGPPAITSDDRRRRHIFEAGLKDLEPVPRTHCEAKYPDS